MDYWYDHFREKVWGKRVHITFATETYSNNPELVEKKRFHADLDRLQDVLDMYLEVSNTRAANSLL